MTGRKCLAHEPWQICEGDIIAVLLPTYKMQVGVVRALHKPSTIALSTSCKNTRPTKYINLQHVVEVYVMGTCR